MIKEFHNNRYGKVRTAIIDDQPCFNLKDLTHIYGIKNINDFRSRIPSNAVKTLEVKDSNGASKNKYFIIADYLSSCMFQSTKTDAEAISDWLYRTVLPNLIKYQKYNVDEFKDPDVALKFLEEFEDLRVRHSVVETQLKLNAPKIKYIDRLLGTGSATDLDMVHEVIRYHGLKSTELLKILRAKRILDDSNVPHQEYCDKKYFRVVEAKVVSEGSTVTSQRTYVYRSGITFIERILKEYQGAKDDKRN